MPTVDELATSYMNLAQVMAALGVSSRPPALRVMRRAELGADRIIVGNAYYVRREYVEQELRLRHLMATEQAEGVDDEPTEKVCRVCRQVLPISQFSKSLGAKDGYHIYCNECRQVYIESRKERQLRRRSR